MTREMNTFLKYLKPRSIETPVIHMNELSENSSTNPPCLFIPMRTKWCHTRTYQHAFSYNRKGKYCSIGFFFHTVGSAHIM